MADDYAKKGELPLFYYDESAKHSMTTRRKLLCLLSIAALALTSILLISEQLLMRHLSRSSAYDEVTLQILLQETGSPLDGVLDDPSLFWNDTLEKWVSPGPSEDQVQLQMQALRQSIPVRADLPDWLHCGREKNRLIHFKDGSQACARFRPRHDEFVQGEVMAFHLARLLRISHTPAVVLSEVNSELWSTVSVPEWPKSNAIVALIEWLPHLTKTTMPAILRKKLTASFKDQPLRSNSDELASLERSDLELLVQWSDMIIFDYLTGNYDRVASMQDGADKEGKTAIMRETIHNLALSEETGSLWFLDNESAFLDAYSLLYDKGSDDNGLRFQAFHERMLRTMCVFRKTTVQRLFALKNSPCPDQLLLEFVNQNEPLFDKLPKIHPNSVFREHFSQRLGQAWSWIEQCHK